MQHEIPDPRTAPETFLATLCLINVFCFSSSYQGHFNRLKRKPMFDQYLHIHVFYTYIIGQSLLDLYTDQCRPLRISAYHSPCCCFCSCFCELHFLKKSSRNSLSYFQTNHACQIFAPTTNLLFIICNTMWLV